MVVVVLVLQEGGGSLGQWTRFLTFTETFANGTLLQVDGVVWSLVVELHFYVLLPFLAWALARLARGSLARAALLLLALGAASLLVQAAFVGFGPPRDPILAYALPARFFFFAPGMLLALLRLRAPQRLPRADLWLLGAAALWLVVFRDYRWAPLAVLPCFLMVGAAVLPLRPGPLVRALEWRPLALVGVASYSLYLWHVQILDALGGPYLSRCWRGRSCAWPSPSCPTGWSRRRSCACAGAGREARAGSRPSHRLGGGKNPARRKPRGPRWPRPEHHAVVREHRAGGGGERPRRSIHRHAHLHDARAAGRTLRRHALDRAHAARAHDHLLVGMGDRRRADDVGAHRVGLVAPAAARQPERGHRRGRA